MAPLVVDVLRSRDLLDLQIELRNLVEEGARSGAPFLRREAPGPAFIIVRLRGQHISEEAFGAGRRPEVPARAFLAGPSVLAFALPDAIERIPLAVEALLDLLTELAPLPLDDAGDPLSVIELPQGLLLVPEPGVRLVHRSAVVTSASTRRTELWQTRLGVGQDAAAGPRFRAIANPFDREFFPEPAAAALTRRNRDDVRSRSAADSEHPHVVLSSDVMLSALGASARLRSGWPPEDASTSLLAWDHEARLGRDVSVRTVTHGCLYPFRHRASVATVTERTFSGEGPAALVTRRTLTVLEQERHYDTNDMPFKTVRIAGVRGGGALAGPRGPVHVDVTASDRAGNVVAFDLKMLFVESCAAADRATLEDLEREYADLATASLWNQSVALADDPDRSGDTTLTVAQVTFGVRPSEGAERPFAPRLESAEAAIPAIEHLLGTTGETGGLRTITLQESYVRDGFREGDKSGVFAKFTNAVPLALPAVRAGGLAAPKFPPLDGLSRLMGPVSDVDKLANDVPMLARDLIDLDARLLGTIKLRDLVSEVTVASGFPAVAPAELYARIADPTFFLDRPVLTTVVSPAHAETRFVWKPRLSETLKVLAFEGRPGLTLVLKGRIEKALGPTGGRPDFAVEGRLANFDLAFGDFLRIAFDELTFTSGGGRPMSARVKIKAVTLGSDLRFLEKLGQLLDLGGLGGSPRIRPRADGIEIGYAIPIPSAPLGVFSIQNIALALSASIPFGAGTPASVRFALSERSHPFLVTASIFGGTGFFALEVRTDGKVQLEAAIEFGGIVALDFVVVRGSVYLLAGIYASVRADGTCLLEGYLRLGGSVEVLLIASASVEFYLGLAYDSGRNVLVGRGRLTVSVRLLFFSKSLSFEVSKEVGFDALPSLGGVRRARPRARVASFRSPLPWREYCAAFA